MVQNQKWKNQNTVEPLLSGLLTNRHLLLPGTIIGHTELISC